MAENITITVTLTPKEAFAFAQFLKRVGFTDYRLNAFDETEAYLMVDAGAEIQKALAKAGYAPR